MRLKTPAFWTRRNRALTGDSLIPLSLLYLAGIALRKKFAGPAYVSRLPVICIGNLTVGGTGKTPAALAIASLLKKHALAANPCFLSRGYGGGHKGPLHVATNASYKDVGDEALLLASAGPTVIARDRRQGALLAEALNADAIVMDDGLQNPGLVKTISLVVIDGAVGFGNSCLLPAGPMRVPLGQGLAMADAFIVIGGTAPPEVTQTGKPVFQASLRSSWRPAPGQNYLAFCGIGRPEKFFKAVQDQGATLVEVWPFADHHAYDSGDLDYLKKLAAEYKARLVTTTKDAVKLPPGFPADIMPVELVWQDEPALAAFLKTKLARP